MLSRLATNRLLGRSPAFTRVILRPCNNQANKEAGWWEETSTYAKKQMHLLQSTMVSQSKIVFKVPFKTVQNVHTLSLSDLAGHASFMFLALSYLENDFLQLRLFAVSGVSLSIIFQYYRERPLWIPIRWNTLFLVINTVMILLLLKEERDAENIPSEKKIMYEATFMKKGMKPVDFLHLCSASERVEVKKGDVIVSEKLKNTRVYLVKSGKLSVHVNGTLVRNIGANQFVGSMSFLSWEDKIDAAKLQRKRQKDSLKNWSNKNSDTELFVPLLIIIENLAKRYHLQKEQHRIMRREEQQATALSAEENNAENSEDASNFGSFFTDLQEDTSYGISMDEHGNVVASEPFDHRSDDHDGAVGEDQQPTFLVNYISASYNYLTGMVASSTATERQLAKANEGNHLPASAAGGMMGYADVIAEEDCVLYFWTFNNLRSLIELYPSLGLAFERALSEDINNKMSRSMQSEPLQRYQLMLSGAVSGGETSDVSKQILADFRNKHSISNKDHTELLEKLGWNTHDFSSGFKGAPTESIQQQYLGLLRTALAGTDEEVLTEEKRTELRVFRKRNNINSAAHLSALRKISWTVDEYEIGSKNPEHASAKEVRAAAANKLAQRRGRIRATVLSYIFPESWSAPAPSVTAVSVSSSSGKVD